MSRSRLVMIGTVVSIVAAFGVAPAAQAAENYFLTFQTTSGAPLQGIAGESKDAFFSDRGAVELNSFDWSAQNPVTFGSGVPAPGKTKLNRLSVDKHVDSASPALFQRMATGTHIPRMVLYVRRAGPTGTAATGNGSTGGAYLQYQFAPVFVASVSPSGDGEQMRERVTFEYGAVKQTYWPTSADGTVFRTPLDASWNQVTDTATL
jgi:type VI secretion system secreted protein Hcp